MKARIRDLQNQPEVATAPAPHPAASSEHETISQSCPQKGFQVTSSAPDKSKDSEEGSLQGRLESESVSSTDRDRGTEVREWIDVY
jgi:hypothetical protein